LTANVFIITSGIILLKIIRIPELIIL